MKRAALWLVSVVREGEVFTKEELRRAFPGVSQVDRRMRDLRDFGWVLHTNRDAEDLDPHEQRFVKRGIPVWEPGKATRPRGTIAIGAGKRREIIASDGNMCRSCGITPGAHYEGTYEAAQLDIARRPVRKPDGRTPVELVTECQRCRLGARELSADLASLLRSIEALPAAERDTLAGWAMADEREFRTVERVWSTYRSLPEESRADVRAALGL
ncbi:hypothetical protein OG211_22575 [Streptomyces niveus]|uniref:hypothetical protein n=1 Tax=Streptomyces niveus TaxID=193462 RepID=UPI0038637296|nr:hypothetical protein OG211_22575 [Streptomyces niveus]